MLRILFKEVANGNSNSWLKNHPVHGQPSGGMAINAGVVGGAADPDAIAAPVPWMATVAGLSPTVSITAAAIGDDRSTTPIVAAHGNWGKPVPRLNRISDLYGLAERRND